MSESIIEDLDANPAKSPKIKIFGVGGCGGNVVQALIESKLQGVRFICADTELLAMRKNQAPVKIQLGEKLTNGLGTGCKPEVGIIP